MASVTLDAVLPWEQFEESAAQAEKLSREEAFDAMEMLTHYFSTLRRYAPALLEVVKFGGASVVQPLLDALQVISFDVSPARTVPSHAPMALRIAALDKQRRRRRCN